MFESPGTFVDAFLNQTGAERHRVSNGYSTNEHLEVVLGVPGRSTSGPRGSTTRAWSVEQGHSGRRRGFPRFYKGYDHGLVSQEEAAVQRHTLSSFSVTRMAGLAMPTEDVLTQSTLWPEIQKLYGHPYIVQAVAVNKKSTLIATSCRVSSSICANYLCPMHMASVFRLVLLKTPSFCCSGSGTGNALAGWLVTD